MARSKRGDLILKMRFASFALVVAMLAVLPSGSYAFTAFSDPADQNLYGLKFGGPTIGDTDNDGDLDLIIMGRDKTNTDYFTLVYTNNGSGSFSLDQNLIRLFSGGMSLGDIDNDSDLDLVQTGQDEAGKKFTLVYTNAAGTFTLDQNLTGLAGGGVALGDLDNDGDIDMIVKGTDQANDYFTQVYTNSGGTFAAGQNLFGLSVGGLGLGDIDDDGDLDLVNVGIDKANFKHTLIYKNDAGTFTIDQNLVKLTQGGVALGDIDNDDDLDIIRTGQDIAGYAFTLVYTNTGGVFSLDQNLTGIYHGGPALADVNNDGTLDLVIAGMDKDDVEVTIVYLNEAGTFTQDQSLYGLKSSSLALGDLDGDEDIDLINMGQDSDAITKYFTLVYLNSQATSNTNPTPPTTGFSAIYETDRLLLRWGDGSDTNTPVNGLYYNLKAGTTDDANDLISPYYGGQGGTYSGHNGMFGNMLKRQDVNLVVTEQTIYWAVQTIDTTSKTSAWSETQVYTPPNKLNIYFADENIMANFADVNILVNGGAGYSTTHGFITIDLNVVQDYNIFAYNDASGYHGRTFYFSNLPLADVDVNALMLEDVNGQTIDFQFYESDTTTLLANTFVTAWKDDNYVGIAQTDASGIVSFFLNTDTNYYFTATDSSSNPIRYDSVEVTSLIPKDEYTLANITPYDFAVKRLADRQDLNLTADFVTYILPDTLEYYVFDYNGGPLYYDRQYEVKVIGNPLSASIQPYLVPKAFSGDFIFNVIDADLLTPLGDVRIVINRTIPGEGNVEIASITTDDAGKANIALLLDTEYNVSFYYGGELKHQAMIRPTAASLFYQVAIDITEEVITPVPSGRLTVLFSPTTTYLPLNSDGGVDINVSITLTDKSISSIYTRVLDTNGCVYDENSFTTPWTDGNTVYYHPDLNTGASTNLYNGLPCIYSDQHGLYVEVDVNSVDGNNFKANSINYNVTALWQFGLEYGLTVLAGELNVGGGKLATSFLAIFITMLATGALAIAGVHNQGGLVFIMSFILGIFAFIQWIDLWPFLFFVSAGILTLLLTRAVFN